MFFGSGNLDSNSAVCRNFRQGNFLRDMPECLDTTVVIKIKNSGIDIMSKKLQIFIFIPDLRRRYSAQSVLDWNVHTVPVYSYVVCERDTWPCTLYGMPVVQTQINHSS